VKEIVTRLGKAGRVVIPAAFRDALDLKPGDTLKVRLDDDGLHLFTERQALERVRAAVRRYVPAGTQLSEELIADRRREAADE
jgi:AbrB family looped-hinge helix DNA binding protein